ncbi:CHAT domain-containing protein, partial [Candidatus Eisenbacteria bacterium]
CNLRKVVLLAGVCTCCICTPRPAIAEETRGSSKPYKERQVSLDRAEVDADRLERQISKLRMAGEYAQAHDLAQQLLGLLYEHPTRMAFRIYDAEWLVRELHQLASLPDEEQRSKALAESLEVASDSCLHKIAVLRASSQYAEALESARHLLSLRKHQPEASAEGISEAERFLKTLSHILALPKRHVAELGIADSLTLFAAAFSEDRHEFPSEHQYEAASKAVTEALEIRRRLLGEEHPDVAECIYIKARIFADQEMYDKAVPLYRQALSIRRKTLNDEHPKVVDTLWSLAAALRIGTAVLFQQTEATNLVEAASLMAEVLSIEKERYGRTHPRVRNTLQWLVDALEGTGDFPSAAAFSRELVALDREFLDECSILLNQSLTQLAGVLRGNQDYMGAEQAYRELLSLGREDSCEVLSARNLRTVMNLAEVLHIQRRYIEAESLYRELLAGHDYSMRALVGLADALHAQGAYTEAEPIFRQALAMATRNVMERTWGWESTALDLVPVILRIKGFTVAKEFLYRVLDIHGLSAHNNPHFWQLRLALAQLLHEGGDFTSAEEHYNGALALMHLIMGEKHPYIASVLSDIARLRRDRGDYAQAQSTYVRALEMEREFLGEAHPLVARTHMEIALLLMDQGDYAEAEVHCRSALAAYGKLPNIDPEDRSASEFGLGAVLLAQGDHDSGLQLLRQAIGREHKYLGNHHPRVIESLGLLARLELWKADYAAVESLLVQACSAYDVARLRVPSGLPRARFLAPLQLYESLAVTQLGLGKEVEAWTSAERGLARSLADLLFAADQRVLSASEIAHMDSLEDALTRLEWQTATFREMTMRDTSGAARLRVEDAQDRLFKLEADWSSFQRKIRLNHPVTEGEALPLERIQAVLSDSMALVGWLDVPVNPLWELTRFESWGYVIRHEGTVRWVRLDLPEPKDDDPQPLFSARAFRRDLTQPPLGLSIPPSPHATQSEEAVWNGRIKPLQDALNDIRELVVIPSGAMVGVPLEALHDSNGNWLADRFRISYSPSATIFAWVLEQSSQNEKEAEPRALLVGDPPFRPEHAEAMARGRGTRGFLAETGSPPDSADLRGVLVGNEQALATLGRLPGTRAEVEAISALCAESKVLLGPQASEQNLARLADGGQLRTYGTIHLATHALVMDDKPDHCSLILSQIDLPDALEAAITGTRHFDGILTIREILRDWELDADLVTLSACKTALGYFVEGEGLWGFAHAFLQVGARSLLVSLWRVDDEAASLLMQRFYENQWGEYEGERGGRHGEPLPKAEALQEAKLWLREYQDEEGRRRFAHPYYWSAFVLIGHRE